ncbi:hypothetical protein L1D29_10955 [Shewanella insulae]|uniref:hypothetical protein n=1 Tax=Shewanella insulae TaxID=2681496 RepID=UPI001EFD580B|nr:hypothetical protein [Shewanella insulae]MCG9713329.1 hypothetical protein [Shewanella insulae]
MSIKNIKNGSNNPWICECYSYGQDDKRVRKKFANYGEAIAFERVIKPTGLKSPDG